MIYQARYVQLLFIFSTKKTLTLGAKLRMNIYFLIISFVIMNIVIGMCNFYLDKFTMDITIRELQISIFKFHKGEIYEIIKNKQIFLNF